MQGWGWGNVGRRMEGKEMGYEGWGTRGGGNQWRRGPEEEGTRSDGDQWRRGPVEEGTRKK